MRKMFRALFHWPGVLGWLLVLPALLLVVILIGRWQINRAADATLARIDELYAEHGVPTDVSVFAIEGDPRRERFLYSAPAFWGGFLPVNVTNVHEYATKPTPTQSWPALQITLARWSMSWHEEDWHRSSEQHAAGIHLGFDPLDLNIAALSGTRSWAMMYQNQATAEAAAGGLHSGLPWIWYQLDLADAVLAHPDLAAQLTGISIIAMAVTWVEDELSRYDGDAEDLRMLADRLEEAAGQVDLARGFAVVLAGLYPEVSRIIETLDAPQNLSLSMTDEAIWNLSAIGIATGDLGDYERVRLSWPGSNDLERGESLTSVRADWLRLRAIRTLAPRYFESGLRGPMERTFEIYAAHWADTTQTIFPDEEEALSFGGGWVASIRSRGQLIDTLTAASAALHAEATRIETGQWPEVESLGFDRYGRPLKVRELSDGWLVYSMGPDGLDQQGYWQRAQPHDPPTDDQTPEVILEGVENGRYQNGFDGPSWDDQSFRIYLPEVRGQPAAPWPPRLERSSED